MDSTTIQLPEDVPFVFSLQALIERLQTLTDTRKARGIRYPLDMLLLVAVLVRLAGESRLEPMADWARRSTPQRNACGRLRVRNGASRMVCTNGAM
ncbi:MAG: transposase family protein [Chloroflexales bacterium]